jgi:copper chaperone
MFVHVGDTPGPYDQPQAKEPGMATTTYTVTGMTCGHCVSSVREEIGKIDGVTGVDVDLASGAVRVDSTAPLADADIVAAVDEAGYEVAV